MTKLSQPSEKSIITRDTRRYIIYNVQRVIKILDIGASSMLERTLQIVQIDSIKHLLRHSDTSLSIMEYKKSDVLTPVLDYQIARLHLFIEFYKYRTRVSNHMTDYLALIKYDLD